MIGGLLIVFGGLFILLTTAAYVAGKGFKDTLTRRRIMIGTLVAFFLLVMGFFGFLALYMSRKSLINY
jgi:hypothetical protein